MGGMDRIDTCHSEMTSKKKKVNRLFIMTSWIEVKQVISSDLEVARKSVTSKSTRVEMYQKH